MASIPILPEWHQLHPLMVHFPIGLLLIAPLFILIGVLRSEESGRSFLLSGLLLILTGTAGLCAAAWSGTMAGSEAILNAQLRAVLNQHRVYAETTRINFFALTAIFAAIVITPRLFSKTSTRVVTNVLPAVFLVLYTAGAVLLLQTVNTGGTLVHEYGVTGVGSSTGGGLASR